MVSPGSWGGKGLVVGTQRRQISDCIAENFISVEAAQFFCEAVTEAAAWERDPLGPLFRLGQDLRHGLPESVQGGAIPGRM